MNEAMRNGCLDIAMAQAVQEGDESVISIRGRIQTLNVELMKLLEKRIPEELRHEEIDC